MAKTSIFSNKYEKKMRRRRFVRNILILVALVAVVGLAVYKPLMNKINEVRLKVEQENIQKETPPVENPVVTAPGTETPGAGTPAGETPVPGAGVPEAPAGNTFRVTLNSGLEVSLPYDVVDGKNVFRQVVETDTYAGDVSPTRALAVIIDKVTQESFLVDEQGTLKEITFKVYKSKSGAQQTREQAMARKPGIVWAQTPKFLDEGRVVYLSVAPWFKEEKYLWVYTIGTDAHKSFQSIKGTDVVLTGLTEKGMGFTLKADGVEKYLTTQLRIVE